MSKITGRERALRRMRALGPEVRKAVRAQLAKEAEDLADLIWRRVPVDTGTLRDSIEVRPGKRPLSMTIKAGGEPTRKRVRKGVKDAHFAKAKVTGGSRGEYDYARAVEFGTSEQQAQPFFWPSYRQRKRTVRRRMNAAAKKGLAKAVQK